MSLPQTVPAPAPKGARFVHIQKCAGVSVMTAEDFAHVRARIGSEVELASANRTRVRPRDYRAHYTPETAAIVGRAYARDVALFGYEF